MGSQNGATLHDDAARPIRELLQTSAGASASETADRLGQLALSDGGKPDDDVAVVVLRRVHSRDPAGAATARAPSGSIAVELVPGPGCPAHGRAALSPLVGALAVPRTTRTCACW